MFRPPVRKTNYFYFKKNGRRVSSDATVNREGFRTDRVIIILLVFDIGVKIVRWLRRASEKYPNDSGVRVNRIVSIILNNNLIHSAIFVYRQ